MKKCRKLKITILFSVKALKLSYERNYCSFSVHTPQFGPMAPRYSTFTLQVKAVGPRPLTCVVPDQIISFNWTVPQVTILHGRRRSLFCQCDSEEDQQSLWWVILLLKRLRLCVQCFWPLFLSCTLQVFHITSPWVKSETRAAVFFVLAQKEKHGWL